MRLRVTALALTWAVCCLSGPLAAQPPAPAPGGGADATKTPQALFKLARDQIREGRFDVAAETLKAFLAANPSDSVYLDLAKNEPTVFLKLRNVPVWSDEAKSQAEAIGAVNSIIAKSEEANKKLYQDPARITKFVNNLGATFEERIYAEQQLKLSGDAIVPIMVDTLRTSSDVNLRAGILGSLSKLEVNQLPGFLAASDGLATDLKLGIFRALVGREDLLNLLSSPDTDFTPHLWYYSAAKTEDLRTLRDYSAGVLDRLSAGASGKKQASTELVAIAKTVSAKTARFRSGDRVKLWSWNAEKLNVNAVDVSKTQASDYFAVRNLRWALERNPEDLAAQELFLALTVERAVEKSQFADLAQSDPALFPILAAARPDLLVGMLDRALREQRTALVLGLTQILAARSEKSAAQAADGKPSVFMRALDYPDTRVQLAAAIGMIKAPIPATHGKNAKIIDILRRAASVDTAPSGNKEMGRALVVDPSDIRANKLVASLKQLGYNVERFVSGRELTRRISLAADSDLIFIDRHVVNPELKDLVPQLLADSNVARRPILIVGSADKTRQLSFELLVTRLAFLIAVTETSSTDVPPPYAFDPRRPVRDLALEKDTIVQLRDKRLAELYGLRFERLRRLIVAASLPQSKTLQALLDSRLPQLTYIALATEYPITLESAPATYKQMVGKTQVILTNPQLAASAERLPTETITRLVEELESSLDAPRKQRLDELMSRVNFESLGLPADSYKDPVVEALLGKFARTVGGVSVIPESFTAVALGEDILNAVTDPAQLPQLPADRKRSAKLAMEYLRKLALGEIPGYDVRPAETALRQALRDDELADLAVDAVAKIPTSETQQDLLSLGLGGGKPVPLRSKALDRTIQHIQSFGKLIPANQLEALSQAMTAEPSLELKAKLAVVNQLLVGKSSDLGKLIQKYPAPLPQLPAINPQVAPEPAEKKVDKN